MSADDREGVLQPSRLHEGRLRVCFSHDGAGGSSVDGRMMADGGRRTRTGSDRDRIMTCGVEMRLIHSLRPTSGRQCQKKTRCSITNNKVHLLWFPSSGAPLHGGAARVGGADRRVVGRAEPEAAAGEAVPAPRHRAHRVPRAQPAGDPEVRKFHPPISHLHSAQVSLKSLQPK